MSRKRVQQPKEEVSECQSSRDARACLRVVDNMSWSQSPYIYTYAHKCWSSACKVEEGYECQEVPDSVKRHNSKPDRITGVCARA
jgi:hypothetical protein